ncbi:MAG TPA: ABC transporter permease [Rectinemataceae bacterium]|nr:ABC transporter permease [Rectinemataceae bacterium]
MGTNNEISLLSRLNTGLSRNTLRLRVISVLLSLIAVVAVFSFTTQNFLTLQNLKIIAFNASLLTIVACAEAIVVITRNLDVSVGSIIGLAGFAAAKFAAANQHSGLAIVAVAVAIGLVLGLLNGLAVAYGRVPSIVATLGTLAIFRGVTFIIGRGIEVPSGNLPRWMIKGADATVLGLPVVVLLAVAVVAVLAFLLRSVPIFRRVYAVGSNPGAAVFYGLRANRVVLFAFAVCGALVGFASFLYISRVGTITVNLGRDWEMMALAAVVLGGVSTTGGSGNIVGVFFGALILSSIDNGLVLAHAPEFWRRFIQGFAIVGAITLDAGIERRIQALFRHKKG